jgi:hypothetical protein
MSRMSEETGRIRRQRGRRLDLTVLVGLMLVAVVVAALLLTRPTPWSTPSSAPTTQQLADSVRVCPAPLAGRDQVAATSDAAGTLATVPAVLPGRLRPGTVVTAAGGGGPVVLTASGAAAGGFAAGRWSTAPGGPLSASDCSGPATDAWYTGLGAGAVHDSVLTLTNPTDGEAVVDVILYGSKGPVEAPTLRGVALQPQSSKSFDLLRTVPMNGDLAAHVSVIRGQAASDVVDEVRSLTGGKPIEEWVAPQSHASRTSVLLGIDPTHGSHTLYVANPTDRQLTADLKLVTADSVLTPDGAPTLKLAPQSVVSVSLDKLLAEKVSDGALGVQLDASGAVTASLRRSTGDDLLSSTSGDPVGQPVSVLVPPGAKQLVLLGDTGVGAVTVTATDADGKQVADERVSVTADQGASVELPTSAVAVAVTPSNVSVVGTVVVTDHGTATAVPLRERVRRNLVPAVRPGLR